MDRRYRNCIGPEVRELRKARVLTQEQLAAKLQLAGLHSIDRVGIAKIETQIRSVFDYELAVIAQVMGVELADLIPSPERLKRDLGSLIGGKR
ncbi:MAG: helix-turn-helix transcriptional regulator [Akkermansiaceae bacterium]|nr:helix-turn-helix transcriptional regulator [Akkermansiaceae bacterium]